MRIKKCHTAFTLIEMLVVVSLIAILVTLVISVAARLDTQGKINSTKGTLALLDTALSEFHDYGFTYSDATKYGDCKFPVDCNSFSKNDFENAMEDAIDTTRTVSITYSTAYDPNNSGTQALYFLLSRPPRSSRIIEKISRKMLTYDGEINVQNEGDFPLWHINDGWGRPLRYYYYDFVGLTTTIDDDTIKTFPVITSAGPDGIFDTADDIKNR